MMASVGVLAAREKGETPPDLDQNFVFPARPTTSPSATGSTSLLGAQLPAPNNLSLSHRRAFKRNTPSTLPAFNFNPAGDGDGTTSKAPSGHRASASMAMPLKANTHAHRRRESAYVGGDGSRNGPGLMSTSPTKGEGALPLPPTARTGPSGPGHRHRRSAAISSHDVTTFMSKPGEGDGSPRAGSAPTTPAAVDPDFMPSPIDRLNRAASAQQLGIVPGSPDPEGSQARPRVGFSDRIEIIPRPRSTISTDTSSSSTSTILAGSSGSQRLHHTTGSVASITSFTGSGPAPFAMRADLGPTSSPSSSVRSLPRETQPLSDVPVNRGSSNVNRRPPTPPMKLLKRVDGYDPRQEGLSDCALPPDDPDLLVDDDDPSERTFSRRKQVRSWAESFIPRRAKSRGEMKGVIDGPNELPPSDPAGEPGPAIDVTDDVPFGETQLPPPMTPPAVDTIVPPSASPETTSPMIDLDAALGPFNTPQSKNTSGGASNAGIRPWRMYSAKPDSPESPVHRRADSEPALPAFRRDHPSIQRLGSSSTMADVIVEEGEDEDERVERPGRASSETEENAVGIGIQVVESDSPSGEMDWTVDETALQRRPTTPSPERRDSPAENLQTQVIPEEPAVRIVDETDLARSESVGKSSDSTITPPALSPKIDYTHPVHPLPSETEQHHHHIQPSSIMDPMASTSELAMPSLTPETCSTLTTSTISSPDFPPGGFDVPLAIAHASSFSDAQHLDSLMGGEPGPELRSSVDDVPSLTSSSTMGSHHASHDREEDSDSTPLPDPSPLAKERSASLSAAVPTPRARRTRSANRSSLVSLSRLMGSGSTATGEKSKLSIEARADADEDPNGSVGGSVGRRRLSRLKFWRSRESLTAAAQGAGGKSRESLTVRPGSGAGSGLESGPRKRDTRDWASLGRLSWRGSRHKV